MDQYKVSISVLTIRVARVRAARTWAFNSDSRSA